MASADRTVNDRFKRSSILNANKNRDDKSVLNDGQRLLIFLFNVSIDRLGRF